MPSRSTRFAACGCSTAGTTSRSPKAFAIGSRRSRRTTASVGHGQRLAQGHERSTAPARRQPKINSVRRSILFGVGWPGIAGPSHADHRSAKPRDSIAIPARGVIIINPQAHALGNGDFYFSQGAWIFVHLDISTQIDARVATIMPNRTPTGFCAVSALRLTYTHDAAALRIT